ncbi:MAG: outer membrane lipoprotein carrier protein LolA [Paludibacteraceae bacterium]|nr:outer membrane lipoprotein carrier protein LolA [Paludibacteraceae bacterium]
MKRLIFILLSVFSLNALYSQNEVLEAMIQRFKTEYFVSDITITITENNQPMTFTGKVKLHSEQFYIAYMDGEMAFDGTTMYNYQEDIDELTLSYPTMAEQIDANPMLFVESLLEESTVRQTDNERQYLFTITPNNKQAGVSRFTLVVNKQTQLPEKASMVENVSRETKLVFNNSKYTKEPQIFSIEKDGATVTDLRLP